MCIPDGCFIQFFYLAIHVTLLTAEDNINFTVTGGKYITVRYVECGLVGCVAMYEVCLESTQPYLISREPVM
jgi:invasion protein IalB